MSEEANVSGDTIQEAAVPTPVDQGNVNEDAPVSEEQKTVPLTALQAERTQRQQAQDELKLMKDHLALSQANQPQTPPQDEFEGLVDSDILTVGEFKKLTANMSKQFKTSIEELKIAQKNPDYQEVITKYLPDVLKQNPGLQNTLQKTQDYELAYYLAKNSENYRSDNRKYKQSADAKRIVENSQKAGSLSSLGAPSPISHAKRYKDMSDDDFKKLVSRHLG